MRFKLAGAARAARNLIIAVKLSPAKNRNKRADK